MSVRLLLSCGGCDATAETEPLRKRFVSFSGRPHGFGRYVVDDPESLTPPGWWMFDPYTQATYCPSCRWRIEAKEVLEEVAANLSVTPAEATERVLAGGRARKATP